jgi:hypothetical protein
VVYFKTEATWLINVTGNQTWHRIALLANASDSFHSVRFFCLIPMEWGIIRSVIRNYCTDKVVFAHSTVRLRIPVKVIWATDSLLVQIFNITIVRIVKSRRLCRPVQVAIEVVRSEYTKKKQQKKKQKKQEVSTHKTQAYLLYHPVIHTY